MARIYANENFFRPTIHKLRELGHDVLKSLEAGNANQKIPDEEVLRFAIAEKRIMLTLNRKHFIRLRPRPGQNTGGHNLSDLRPADPQTPRHHSCTNIPTRQDTR